MKEPSLSVIREVQSDRTVFAIQPIEAQGFHDSGQINGLSGTGITYLPPLTDKSGTMLEFETYEEAEAEAIRLGYDRGNVTQIKFVTLKPDL